MKTVRRLDLKYRRNYLKKKIMDEIIDFFDNNQQEIDIDSSYHMKYICDDRCFGF